MSKKKLHIAYAYSIEWREMSNSNNDEDESIDEQWFYEIHFFLRIISLPMGNHLYVHHFVSIQL